MIINRKNFTLLELLIVIAIIGVLISILLPSLRKAQDAAKGTVCLSNQRQVGVAIMLFSKANNGDIPKAGGTFAGVIGSPDYLNTPKSGTILEQSRGNVLYCPMGLTDKANSGSNAFDTIEEALRPWKGYDDKYGWYAIVGTNDPTASNGWRQNTWRLSSGGTYFPKLFKLENLLSSAAILDGKSYHNTSSGSGGRISPRHANYTKTNILFYDGHAKSYLYSTVISSRSNNGSSNADIVWWGSRAN